MKQECRFQNLPYSTKGECFIYSSTFLVIWLKKQTKKNQSVTNPILSSISHQEFENHGLLSKRPLYTMHLGTKLDPLQFNFLAIDRISCEINRNQGKIDKN